MCGKTISLMMSFMALGTFMTAQELPIQGDFSTIGGNSLPVNWEQDKGENFQPLGKVEMIDETIEKPIKAVRLTSDAKPTLVHTVQPYPVQGGDCVLVRLFFKGTGVAEVGYYGYYGYDASRPEAVASDRHSFKTYSEDWDCRSRVFEISDPKITAIRIFFSTPAGTTMSFANLTARKLSKEEAALFSPTTNRKLWERRIQGVNLAAGKKVSFDPKPNYELTRKGDTDETDLTDGKLGKPNDMLLLIGNYGKLSEAETTIELPPGGIGAVVDLKQNTPVAVKGKTLTVKIKPDDYGFYHIQYK